MKHLPLTILKVLLAVAVVALGYQFYRDIKGPVEFTEESAARDEVVREKLEVIADAQDAYYRITGSYTDNFDTLLDLCMRDSFTVDIEDLIRRRDYDEDKHGPDPIEYGDTLYYKITKTYRIAIRDSLFNNIDYGVEELKVIPYSNGQSFYMAAAVIDAAGGRYQVPTVMATAKQKHYYAGLDARYYDPNAGYQFGSLSEANTDVYPVEEAEYPD